MSYPLGQPVTLTQLVYDSSDVLANAGAVTLTITLPDGTTSTPTVTDPPAVTGTYTYTYTPTTAGLHEVRWVFTGVNATAPPVDVLDVQASSAVSWVSLADLRKHLNWPSAKGTSDDAELLDIAAEAAGLITGRVGPVLRQQVTQVETSRRRYVLLYSAPCTCAVCAPTRILTIDSVTDGDTALDSAQWELGGAALTLDTAPADVLTVVYTVGFTGPPSWAVLALKRLVEHLWTASQQARHTRTGQAQSVGAAGYLLPYAVQSAIDPHRLVPVA